MALETAEGLTQPVPNDRTTNRRLYSWPQIGLDAVKRILVHSETTTHGFRSCRPKVTKPCQLDLAQSRVNTNHNSSRSHRYLQPDWSERTTQQNV